MLKNICMDKFNDIYNTKVKSCPELKDIEIRYDINVIAQKDNEYMQILKGDGKDAGIYLIKIMVKSDCTTKHILEEFSDAIENIVTLMQKDNNQSVYANSISKYPKRHNLDGVYFRVYRNNTWKDICFSDLSKEEQEDVLSNRDIDFIKNLCFRLSDVIREMGESMQIYKEEGKYKISGEK